MTQPHLRHGHRHHPLYATWCNMKARCDNPKHPAFFNYGGRGIMYDPRWATFPNFLNDMGEKLFTETSLDRIDNDGPYSKQNCRWASRSTQRRNSRSILPITIQGETKLLTDWCAVYGINLASVHRRLRKGEDIVSALVRPKAARFL